MPAKAAAGGAAAAAKRPGAAAAKKPPVAAASAKTAAKAKAKAKAKAGAGGNGGGAGEQLDVRAAAAAGRAASAGAAVGVDRIGALRLTTGRMCLCRACDPLGEGDATSSDLAAAGSGAAFYFMFVKAFAWVFTLAALLVAPNVWINMQGQFDGKLGLSLLSRTMLGQLGNASSAAAVAAAAAAAGTQAFVWDTASLPGSQGYMNVRLAVSPDQLPALYSILDLLATLVVSAPMSSSGTRSP